MTDFQSQLNNFYQTSLGRDAGAEGKSYWQGQYDSGMGLDEIQKRIAGSKEAKGILSTTATMADMPTKAQVNDSRSQVYNGVSLNEDNSNFNQWYAEKVKSGQGYYGPSGQAIMDAATASGDPARIAAAQKLKQGQYGTGHGWAINGGDAPEMPPEGQQLTGAKAYGYDPTGYKAAGRAKAHGYAAPGAADTAGYDPVMQNMTDEQRSAYQLAQITGQDSPYMRQARLSGLQQANQRGLLNSSIASGAAEAAAIRAAAPFAQQDAGQEFAAERDFANAQNRASEFGASAQNTAELQANQFEDQARRFGAQAENVSELDFARRTDNAEQFTATAINRAGEFYANAQNTAEITNANNELRLALAEFDADLGNYRTDVQRQTALDQLGYNLFTTAIQSGVFNNAEAVAGYYQTVSGLFPDLGIQFVADAADAVPQSFIL